jgi:4-amino-4-deoxy-L-arabinose transferase-like glycosyltransferase
LTLFFRRIWSPESAIHAVIIVSTIAHLILAAIVPLVFHEGHYASYGHRLDWSYVDHPPLVGWLQAIPVWLSGSDLAIRMIPLASTVANQYLVVLLVRTLYPHSSPWLGLIAVLIIQGELIFHAGITMAPEVPFVTLALLTVWLTHRVLETNRWRDWLALAVTLGFAGLAKYTAVTLAVSVVLALLIFGKRAWLLQWRFWAAILIAALISSPVFAWNLAHDWISFAHQHSYQALDRETGYGSWDVWNAVKVQIGQLVAYSLLLYVGAVFASVRVFRGSDDGGRLLLIFALPVLLSFLLISGVTRGRVHWTAAAWLMLVPMVAHWLREVWNRRAARVLTWASGVSSVLALGVAIGLYMPSARFEDHAHPYGELFGWREATAKAVSHAERIAAETPDGEPLMFVREMHHAELLAWYGRDIPVVVIDEALSQYLYWFGRPLPGSRGVLVIPQYKKSDPHQPPADYNCRLLEESYYDWGRTHTSTFRFYRCRVPGG